MLGRLETGRPIVLVKEGRYNEADWMLFGRPTSPNMMLSISTF
jgi:hypothetical protein